MQGGGGEVLKKAIILGGGPAGLSAGLKLCENGVETSVIEQDRQVGGISKTVLYKGYYFDLGGHRFFTKIPRVQKLWEETLGKDFRITPRLSRIYYRSRFFDYPLSPVNALKGLGFINTINILLSYTKSKITPLKKEETFEQWVSNRFGKKLFNTFFKTYTEKVWGIPCSEIQAEWAAQRIKGLSLKKAVTNALLKPKNSRIKTLINQFHYPVYGPGMMYNAIRQRIENTGGSVCLESRVVKVIHHNGSLKLIEYTDGSRVHKIEGTHFISTIPVTELVKIMEPAAPQRVLDAAGGLSYRSMLTVDVIVNREALFPDNWIYIHSPEVRLGRIQNFKNWSREMAADRSKTSLGLEYFCYEGDNFWNTDDKTLYDLAASELEKINICKAGEIEDYTVIRVPKAYPVYDRGYKEKLLILYNYLRKFDNLQLAGRYGLFKYNNMDHSILTGLYSAANVIEGKKLYDTVNVNTEQTYHEEVKNNQ